MSDKLKRLFGNDPRPFEQIRDYKKDLVDYYSKVDEINKNIMEKDKDSITLYNIMYKLRASYISYDKLDTIESKMAKEKIQDRFNKVKPLYEDSVRQKDVYKLQLKNLRENLINSIVGTSNPSVTDQFKFDLINMNEAEVMKKIEEILKLTQKSSSLSLRQTNENSVAKNLLNPNNRSKPPARTSTSSVVSSPKSILKTNTKYTPEGNNDKQEDKSKDKDPDRKAVSFND